MIVVMIACNIQMPAVGEGAFDAATYRADSERGGYGLIMML